MIKGDMLKFPNLISNPRKNMANERDIINIENAIISAPNNLYFIEDISNSHSYSFL